MAFGAEVAELIVALRLDDKGFSGKLNTAARSLRGMDAGLSQMGRGAGQVASGLGRLGDRAAIAAAGGLAAVVTTAASFEQAFTGVEKTVDGTDAQLAELERTLRGMARTMPVSFEELAGIGEAGGALGIARESLDEFVDVVARLAVSTDLSSEAAATSLGQLGNVLGLTGQDYEDFADSLVALGNAGASTESQIVEIAARFGAAGNAAGLSKEEILALSSAVASMGIEVEAGGSSLSRIFSNVATAIGTGGDEVEAFTELLGISADEFQDRWSQDALGTFQDFLQELSKLDQFGQARVLEDAGITGVRDINAVRLMAQNFEFLNEQLVIAEDATGALGTESDKFFATTAAQWQVLKNNVRDAAAVLGTDLLPVVNEVMKEFVGFLNQPGTQAGLKQFATDLAEGVRGLAQELKGTDFSGIIGGVRLAAEVAKGAFDAFRSLPQPIQQLAIAALVANKVSGGAIGSIAAGLGNLVLGGLKTIMATHVTVVGGTVTGGPGGGVPGGAGGLATLARAGAVVAGGAAVGAAAVTVVNFEEMRNEQRGKLQGILDELPRTPEAIDASMLAINAELMAQRPFLEGILFHTNIRPQLEAELAELQLIKDAANRGEIATRDAIPWHQRNVTEIQNLNASEGQRFAHLGALSIAEKDAIYALNASEGARAATLQGRVDAAQAAIHTLNANEGSRAASLMAIGSTANSYNARTAAASERTAAKNFSPLVKTDVNVTVPITNVINSTVIQSQIHQLRTTTGSGGFI